VLLGRESCFKIVKFEDSEERSIMWAVRRVASMWAVRRLPR